MRKKNAARRMAWHRRQTFMPLPAGGSRPKTLRPDLANVLGVSIPQGPHPNRVFEDGLPKKGKRTKMKPVERPKAA